MCGRYTLEPEANETLNRLFDKANLRHEESAGVFPMPMKKIATGEIFPSDTILTLLGDKATENVGAYATRWGIRSKSLVINARAETLLEKVTFRPLFSRQRCVIPTNGFFEWQHGNKKNEKSTKYYFGLGRSTPLYLAGLYRVHEGELESVIITTASNPSISEVHDRMPLIIAQEDLRRWLFDDSFAQKQLQREMPSLMKDSLC